MNFLGYNLKHSRVLEYIFTEGTLRHCGSDWGKA